MVSTAALVVDVGPAWPAVVVLPGEARVVVTCAAADVTLAEYEEWIWLLTDEASSTGQTVY